MKTRLMAAAAYGAIMIGGSLSTQASAAIIINTTQVGANVVATGSGSFNTEGLTLQTERAVNAILSTNGIIRFGTGSGLAPSTTAYITGGPASFGPNVGVKTPTSAVGDRFGIYGLAAIVSLPVNYTSGAQLAGTMTFAGATLTSLGLTTGSYVYTAPNDTLTVNIGPSAVSAAVPESAT